MHQFELPHDPDVLTPGQDWGGGGGGSQCINGRVRQEPHGLTPGQDWRKDKIDTSGHIGDLTVGMS